MDIDKLLDKLYNEPDLDKRRYIPDKLAKLGDWKSTIHLGELIVDRSQPEIMRNEAVESLGKQGDPQAIQFLIKVLNDPDDEIRRTAVWALGQIGTPETLDPVFSKRNDPYVEVRRWVAKSAGRIRNDDVIFNLIGYFEEIQPKKDQRVLADIIRAFSSQITRTNYEQRKYLADQSKKLLDLDLKGFVHQASVLLLSECYSFEVTPDISFLREKLKQTSALDPLVRPGLVMALGHAGDKEYLRKINSIQAIKSLGFAGDAKYLENLLEEEEKPERLVAILEGLFYTECLPELTPYLTHNDLSVRQRALAIHAKHKLDFGILKEAYEDGRGTYFILSLFKYYGEQAIPIYQHSALNMDKVARQTSVHALISSIMLKFKNLHSQIRKILEQVNKKDRIWHIRRDARIGIEKIESDDY